MVHEVGDRNYDNYDRQYFNICPSTFVQTHSRHDTCLTTKARTTALCLPYQWSVLQKPKPTKACKLGSIPFGHAQPTARGDFQYARISVLDQGNYHTPSMCSRNRPHVFTPRLRVASHCSSAALACGASAKAVYAKLQKPRADRKKLCKVKRFANARRAKIKGAPLSPL